MKALNGLWNYLKDWKNLLTHALIGVGILLVAFLIPVKPVYRIGILILVVIFNLLRMRFEKKKEQETVLENPPIEVSAPGD